MSGVVHVADETCQAQKVVEAPYAEAKSVQGAVESRVASFSAQADASATHAVEVMTGRVQEMATHSEAQTSYVAAEVTHNWKRKLKAW